MPRIERPTNDCYQGQEDGIRGIVESHCSAPVTDGICNKAHNAMFSQEFNNRNKPNLGGTPFYPPLLI